MDSLLLDRTVWDLCLNADGNIAVASDPYALAQNAASACRLFLGELWYDVAPGVPYFEEILGHTPSVAYMRGEFHRAAMTVPGVVAAACFLSAIRGRALTGQVHVTDRTGAVSVAGF